MRAIRTFTWLPAVLSFAALQACGSTSTSTPNDPGSAGATGVSGAPTSNAGTSPVSSGGSSSGGPDGGSSDGGSAGKRGGKGGKGGMDAGGGVDAGGSPSGGTGGQAVGGGSNGGGTGGYGDPPAGGTLIGKFTLSWYSFQDNTPTNSQISASGHLLIPYVSIAVPYTQIVNCAGEKPKKGTTCTGTLKYGDKLYVDYLHGRKMPNGMTHTGWVMIDDYCGDGHDDTYCYLMADDDGKAYPNVDLYIGDFAKSGMMPMGTDQCGGPAGGGTEGALVYSGDPGAAFVNAYGGARLGTGLCGDRQKARDDQFGPKAGAPFGAEPAPLGSLTACWGYDQQDDNSGCADCVIGKGANVDTCIGVYTGK